MAWLADHHDSAIARGYLLKGTRAIMWDRPQEEHCNLAKAIELQAEIDEPFVREVIHQLLTYEIEFGAQATQEVVRDLAHFIQEVGDSNSVRSFRGIYWFNRAFHSYRSKEYTKVPIRVSRAVFNNPGYLANRGLLAILLRSMVRQWSEWGA
jgi:hypothetical protein